MFVKGVLRMKKKQLQINFNEEDKFGELIECCLTKNHEDNIKWLEHYISVARINPFDKSDDRVKIANNYLEIERGML